MTVNVTTIIELKVVVGWAHHMNTYPSVTTIIELKDSWYKYYLFTSYLR